MSSIIIRCIYYKTHLQLIKLLLRIFILQTMSFTTRFSKVPERPSFPQEEEKILAHWEKIDAFKTQLKMSEGKKPYTFYDGPPFATGTPHYGHIAAGTIKDVMTRYAT
jgi:isoleucyl-tRNA synthetase